MRCPCGDYELKRQEDICPYCGILIGRIRFGTTNFVGATEDDSDTQTTNLKALLGPAYFDDYSVLVLRVRDTGREYSFKGTEFAQVTLGRLDPATGEKPDVDLSSQDGIEKGVSRQHARIVRKDERTLQIVDEGAQNHTFINGIQLVPRQARTLRDGDELRLGRLVLLVQYIEMPKR